MAAKLEEQVVSGARTRPVPDPEASLLQGILQGVLLGIKSGIPDELYEDYNTTGTSHIFVISGSNSLLITIITCGVGRALSANLGRMRIFGQDTLLHHRT